MKRKIGVTVRPRSLKPGKAIARMYKNNLARTSLNNINWQRTFHFKDLIAIFWGLQTLWPYLLAKPGFFRVRVVLRGMVPPKRSR